MGECYKCKHRWRSGPHPTRPRRYFCDMSATARDPVSGACTYRQCAEVRGTPQCQYKPKLIARLIEVFS